MFMCVHNDDDGVDDDIFLYRPILVKNVTFKERNRSHIPEC